jgi:hypothetical protein
MAVRVCYGNMVIANNIGVIERAYEWGGGGEDEI